jgi:subtilisin family serine protease
VEWLLLLVHIAAAGGPSDRFAAPLPQSNAGAREGQAVQGTDAAALPQAEDEILVQFSKGAAPGAIASVHGRIGATVVQNFSLVAGLQLVKVPRGLSVKEAIARYRAQANVLYAEPNFRLRVLRAPNDPSFGDLWGLHNTAQGGGANDADIDAPVAWDRTQGSSGVVVAVIDTGIDYTHPDLAANIWATATLMIATALIWSTTTPTPWTTTAMARMWHYRCRWE